MLRKQSLFDFFSWYMLLAVWITVILALLLLTYPHSILEALNEQAVRELLLKLFGLISLILLLQFLLGSSIWQLNWWKTHPIRAACCQLIFGLLLPYSVCLYLAPDFSGVALFQQDRFHFDFLLLFLSLLLLNSMTLARIFWLERRQEQAIALLHEQAVNAAQERMTADPAGAADAFILVYEDAYSGKSKLPIAESAIAYIYWSSNQKLKEHYLMTIWGKKYYLQGRSLLQFEKKLPNLMRLSRNFLVHAQAILSYKLLSSSRIQLKVKHLESVVHVKMQYAKKYKKVIMQVVAAATIKN